MSQYLHNYIHLFRSIGKCCSADFFRNHLNHMTCLLSTIRHIWGSWDVSLRFLEKGKNSQYLKSTKKDLILGTQKLETHNLIVDLNSIIEEKIQSVKWDFWSDFPTLWRPVLNRKIPWLRTGWVQTIFSLPSNHLFPSGWHGSKSLMLGFLSLWVVILTPALFLPRDFRKLIISTAIYENDAF